MRKNISLIAKKLRKEVVQKYGVYKKKKESNWENKCPEMTLQSSPVFCFRFRSFVPTGSEISLFWCIKTQGK